MVMGVKHKIKSILPDKVIYQYEVIRLVPDYVRACSQLRNKRFKSITLMSNKETVDEIKYEGKSLGRFGDGEFLWMLNRNNTSFQKSSEKLRLELINIMKNKRENLLIGIPGGILDPSLCNNQAKFHWTIIKNEIYPYIEQYLDSNVIYSDASITRPYIDYRDRKFSENSFKNLQRIWEDRDVVIVEGENTKLGLGNDLFNNVKSLNRILCPSENAYERIDEIVKTIIDKVDKKCLLLGALGPTATVLAFRLSELGFQFVDVGHIDIEYMWFLNNELIRKPVEGKSVNESNSRKCSELYNQDQRYVNSIIDVIK